MDSECSDSDRYDSVIHVGYIGCTDMTLSHSCRKSFILGLLDEIT